MKYLLLLLLLFISFPLWAATGTVSGDLPTTYEDGTPLDQTKIKETIFYYEIDAPVTELSASVSVPYGTTSADLTLTLDPRIEPYTFNWAAKVVLNDGRESVLSATASKSYLIESTANPSTPVTINFTLTCPTGLSCTIVATP